MTAFLKGMSSHQRIQPETDDWLTPPEIVRELGPFDLDPCASCSQVHLGGPVPKIGEVRYCRCDDGLSKTWHGMIFMNPPYGPSIGRWIQRMSSHGHGIALVFARTETGWFHDGVFRTAGGLFFVMGRLRFLRPDGQPGDYTGGAPSVLVSWGEKATLRLSKLRMKGRFVALSR